MPAAAAATLRSRANAWRVRWPLSLSAGNSQGLCGGAWRAFLEQRAIEADRRARRLGDRHQPLLVALAAHGDQRLARARRRFRQGDQFGDAQARGVEQFDQAGHPRRRQPLAGRHGPARRCPSRATAISLSTSAMLEHFGQRPRAARAFDRQGRIVGAAALEIEMLVELPHRGELARQATRRFSPTAARCGQKGARVVARGAERIGAALARERRNSPRGRADRLRSCCGSPRARRRSPRERSRSGGGRDASRIHGAHFRPLCGMSTVCVISRGCTFTKATSAIIPP